MRLSSAWQFQAVVGGTEMGKTTTSLPLLSEGFFK